MTRRFAALAVAALALGATPAAADPVAGLYAGIIAGGVAPGTTGSAIGQTFAFFETDDAAPLQPGTISVVDPPVDPDLLAFLNATLADVAQPAFGLGGQVILDGLLERPGALLGGGVVGYGFGNGVRLEAELSGTRLAAGDFVTEGGRIVVVEGGLVGTDWEWELLGTDAIPPDLLSLALPLSDIGDYTTDVQFLLASVWYDFDTGTVLTPYVGGGLGVARVTSTLSSGCGCSPIALSSTGFAPAAQLGAGLRVALGAPMTLDLGYRLKAAATAPDLGLAETDAGLAYGLSIGQTGPLLVHALQVGLTFALQ